MDVFIIISYALVLTAIFVVVCIAYQKSRNKHGKHSNEANLYEFELRCFTGRHWLGSFKDGKITKYGFINLPKDGFESGQLIRVWVDHMDKGLWEAEAMQFDLQNFTENTAILTEQEGEHWHCIYPNEQGIALVGYVDGVPKRFVTGDAVKVTKAEGNKFKFVSAA